MKRPLLAAGGFALLALFLSWGYLQIKVRTLGFSQEPVPVLISKKDFQAGETLDEAWVESVDIPRRFLQPAVLADPEAVNGMVAVSPILEGEQILATKLAAPGVRTGLAMQIPEGLRALSLKVDPAAEVGGLLRPNDFVDVLATFELEADTGETRLATYTIVPAALVLAVGQDLGFVRPKGEKKKKWDIDDLTRRDQEKTVTLALTPVQAQKVALADDQGHVVLALRPQTEAEQAAVAPTSLFELTGVQGKGLRERFREYRGR
ncbi:MAG: Flp pilus assembly protein CpaB [Deltaproteobacteria bacterium]|nr:Flp pilus assembly protein CpaB [Deltaproteobacteria bacterium]